MIIAWWLIDDVLSIFIGFKHLLMCFIQLIYNELNKNTGNAIIFQWNIFYIYII